MCEIAEENIEQQFLSIDYTLEVKQEHIYKIIQ